MCFVRSENLLQREECTILSLSLLGLLRVILYLQEYHHFSDFQVHSTCINISEESD
jgi:hypothetical protein